MPKPTKAHQSRLVIFDDGRGQFGPMTDLRASFELRTGMVTTARRIRTAWPKALVGYWVPAPIRELVAARADAPVNDLPEEEILFLVNGRWAQPNAELDLDVNTALIEQATGDVIAACMPRASAGYFLETGELHERVHTVLADRRVLYRFPWDVLAVMKESIPQDILGLRLPEARVVDRIDIAGNHPVQIDPRAEIGLRTVLDATEGPITVHERATIRAGAVLCGPCSIGPYATVNEHAHIKANTVIGPACKVGGEIGGTIFQGFSNKSHDGHLGDSWVGKWVNFGAGTINSNLLNTYGEVTMRVEPDGPRQRTGLTFLGAIVGDHVKTAIGTRLMTGSCLGTGAMLAATMPPPDTVPAFAWLTDEGQRTYRLEKFLEVMRTVMARRERTPRPEYVERLRAVYAARVQA